MESNLQPITTPIFPDDPRGNIIAH